MAHPMTPPHSFSPDRPFLDASPVFSDYFTESSPSTNCGSTVLQMQLLRRLDSFRDQIANVEPSSKSAKLLEAQFDGLETALNAPETQTRETTDLEDSGLFLSDSEDEELRERIEQVKRSAAHAGEATSRRTWGLLAQLASKREKENRELRNAAERLSKVYSDFGERFREVKHVNELMQQQLRSGKDEVDRLASLNRSLKDENQALREDLQLTGSELVFLKLQLNAIEQEASAFLRRDGVDKAFETALQRWKLDWQDVKTRYDTRKRPQQAADTSDPSTSSDKTLKHKRSLSETNLTRPGISERSATFPSTKPAAQEVAASDPPSRADDSKEASEDTKPEAQAEPPKVSRWTAFWDALADAAGVLDYNKILHDDEK